MSGDEIGPSRQDNRRSEPHRDKHTPLPALEAAATGAAFAREGGLPINDGSSDPAWTNQSLLEEPNVGRILPATDDVKSTEGQAEKDADETTVEPRLQAYFGPDVVQLAAFVRALKKAKIRRFDPDDILAAEMAIAENDKEGSRLWQLVAHASNVGPVSTWGWPFIQKRINTLVGAQIDLRQESPSRILDRVITAISDAPSKEIRHHPKRAENDLRLTIAWLLERRNADVTDVAPQVRHFFVGADADVEERVRRAVSTGSRAELQTAIAALHLVNEQIQTAKRERDFERRELLN
ncbi:hypothetical protein LZK80_09540 [Rhizobium leguminosarum]|nr:hypothetical protein LZK80_09540 [Rhizobium leguminosarum]